MTHLCTLTLTCCRLFNVMTPALVTIIMNVKYQLRRHRTSWGQHRGSVWDPVTNGSCMRSPHMTQHGGSFSSVNKCHGQAVYGRWIPSRTYQVRTSERV